MKRGGWTYTQNDEGEECYEVDYTDDNVGDGWPLRIYNNDGYAGAKGLNVANYVLSWEQLEAFINALTHAEKRWKK